MEISIQVGKTFHSVPSLQVPPSVGTRINIDEQYTEDFVDCTVEVVAHEYHMEPAYDDERDETDAVIRVLVHTKIVRQRQRRRRVRGVLYETP